jgi:signal transduction histidine kinase
MDETATAADDDFIRSVPLFAGLSREDADALRSAATRITVEPGDCFIEEGAPGDTLYIILSGELEVTKRDGGRELTLATRRPGEFIGEMSLIEQAPRSASVRAVARSDLLAIGPEAFHALLTRRPDAATTLLRTVAGRLRSTESSLVQADKLAALGTLAAGLAHELNNPAAAIQRSVDYLGEAQQALRQSAAGLARAAPDDAELARLAALERELAGLWGEVPSPPSAVEEDELATALQALDVEQPWDIASAMAQAGWTARRLADALSDLRPATRPPVARWLGAAILATQIAGEVRMASTAISRIVAAVKSYAYLDQAPVQDVDVARSLEDTLMILNHKLKHGIGVERDFDPALPRIEAYAGELNQVWTNIIDNAIHAMNGNGTLSLSAHGLGADIEVRIADSGPGIPAAVAGRIFEPFFTTKPQGEGTGLGLHIAHNIVVNRHRGRISLDTRPGRTEFRIVLPVKLAEPQVRKPSDG